MKSVQLLFNSDTQESHLQKEKKPQRNQVFPKRGIFHVECPSHQNKVQKKIFRVDKLN